MTVVRFAVQVAAFVALAAFFWFLCHWTRTEEVADWLTFVEWASEVEGRFDIVEAHQFPNLIGKCLTEVLSLVRYCW